MEFPLTSRFALYTSVGVLALATPAWAADTTDLATPEPVDDLEEYRAEVAAEAPADSSREEAARASALAPPDSSEKEARRAASEAAPDTSDEAAERARAALPTGYDPDAEQLVQASDDADAVSYPDDTSITYDDAVVTDVITGVPSTYASNRLIVGFTSCGLPASLTVGTATLRRLRDLGGCNATYSVPRTESLERTALMLKRSRGVSYVDFDYDRTILSAPNDPSYPAQWDFHNLGMDVAYDLATGDGTIVAVIDTGVGEGTDGLGTLLPGYDFYANDSNPADEHGHGSHVAATVNQTTNNSVGYAGMAPGAMILPVRVCSPSGSCPSSAIASGINYAVAQGADVINISLGGAFGTTAEHLAIQNARSAGVLVVVAAGNDATGTITFPAAFPESFAVGALDCDDTRSSYSNWGTNLDVMAPGGDSGCYVYQDTPWGTHVGKMGTSMAAPHVAGLAALVMSRGATDDEAEFFMDWVAVDMGVGGYDTDYGYGRVRAAETVSTYSTPLWWTGGGGGGYLYWWYLAADDHQIVGDFDGDGQDELMFANAPWSHLYTWDGSNWDYLWGTGSDWIYWWNMADDDQYVTGDFNGDGADELLALHDPWAHLMEWNGSSFEYTWGTGSGWIYWWNMAPDDTYLTGDFDGDGDDELLAINDPWAHLMEWNGSSFHYVWGTGSGWIGYWNLDDADQYVVADVDGDGADELVCIKDPWVQVMDWNGSSFQFTWGTGSGWLGLWNLAGNDHFAAGDFDGDGAEELFTANDPWAHLHSFTGSGWNWDWGQGAGLFELWYQDDADTYVAGDFVGGDGHADMVSIHAPWWHLMVGE